MSVKIHAETLQIGRRQSVWFAKLTERMMRLWLANVHHQVIAAVLGPQPEGQEITASAVQSKADRVGLPPRHGMTLIRDLDVASKIDRQAAPLPKTIRHQGQNLQLRMPEPCASDPTPQIEVAR